MRTAKRIGGLTIAALIATASLGSYHRGRARRPAAGAFARFAADALFGAAIGSVYWGPYPYYCGYYPAPVCYPSAPYYGPYPYYGYGGCGLRTVWTGRQWRHVRVWLSCGRLSGMIDSAPGRRCSRSCMCYVTASAVTR